MKSESIVFTVAGICFGILIGWILGDDNGFKRGIARAPQASASAPAEQSAGNTAPAARPLDEARVQQLSAAVAKNPSDASATVQLANTYFDAEKYDDAIKWYEQALKLDPRNADASTDLGVSYYYTKRPDHALDQFERSLKINPNHTKTLLNKGIVLAFGKQDLDGAAAAWKKVVEIAPDSREGQAAQRGLEGIAASRQNRGATSSSNQ